MLVIKEKLREKKKKKFFIKYKEIIYNKKVLSIIKDN
jgi:hypothetical protein